MRVDAIVNAANHTLLGGGGVDGAIHRAAGPGLLAECKTLGGCESGQAKITKGYHLPCKYVIHTVGPVWQGGNMREAEVLAACYAASLRLALEYQCESITFPLISSGAYGYPRAEALKIATDTIRDFLLDHDMLVSLVLFDPASFLISQKLYAHIRAYIDDSYIDPMYETAQSRRMAGVRRPFPEAPFCRAPKDRKAEPEGAGIRKAPADRVYGYVDNRSLDEYLDQIDEGFRGMLLRKIDESGMTDTECYKRANVDRKLFNKIKNQADYRPGKSTVLAFAVALKLPLSETESMLRKAGYSLSHSSRFDLIVEYFITHGNYDIFEINEALFSFDQKLLGSAAQTDPA